MFDLAKAVTKTAEQQIQKNGPRSSHLFYQDEECRHIIESCFEFEGWAEPSCIRLSTAKDIDAKALSDIVMLELSQSNDVIEDARRFAAKVPNQKGVIVIGKENSITTLRSLKDMGFYYVFWPINRGEFTQFVRHVSVSQEKFHGVSENRRAKRIAVVGTKGGNGTSYIATMISKILAEKGSETILVDHHYRYSNIDIFLGLKDYQRRDNQELSGHMLDIDEDSAENYLVKAEPHLQVLALTGQKTVQANYDITMSVCDLLFRKANFIIEDYSFGTGVDYQLNDLFRIHDVFVVVVDPSIASVRNAKKIIDTISTQNEQYLSEKRILIVANCHKPKGALALNRQEVEEYLKRKVNVYKPFEKRQVQSILSGQSLAAERRRRDSLYSVATLIQGDKRSLNKGTLQRLKAVFKK